MITQLRRVTLTQLLSCLFFLKVMLIGSDIGEASAFFVLVLALRAEVILNIIYPKQPDVFAELIELNQSLKTLTDKYEVTANQVATLSLGNLRR